MKGAPEVGRWDRRPLEGKGRVKAPAEGGLRAYDVRGAEGKEGGEWRGR